MFSEILTGSFFVNILLQHLKKLSDKMKNILLIFLFIFNFSTLSYAQQLIPVINIPVERKLLRTWIQ